MRLAFLVCCLALAPATAFASGRPSSKSFDCAKAQALVQKQGAITLATGRMTFDRFVASRAFCTVGETLEPAFVPTLDNMQCFIGFRCREIIGQDRK